MPLAPGTRVGSFEVIAALGAGGMGEVYRARDSRLDREVALKVLPDVFTSDPERLARFEREAKVLASLNHPNIAQVYGYEAAAIAMELVEGPTLDEIINGTAPGETPQPGQPPKGLPLERALAIARQIATALEAAHDQGIVHRDLKPANVKVREDGAVKVLDFGLAKAFAADAESAQSAVSNSPTLTARSTQLGMILGTAAYMAPEQAKGRAVDRRADVWAFGVVLFEMLAGRRAFEGEDVSDVLASVLKTEPDWGVLPADLPAPVRRLIQRCLVKDPKRRLRDVAEGLLQMDEGMAAASASASAVSAASLAIPIARPQPLWRRALPIVATAVAAGAIVFAVDRWRTPASVASPPIRFQHVPQTDAPMYTSQAGQDLAISPDGQTIAFVAQELNRPPSLWVRRLDQLEASRLRGGETGIAPFISRDNAWVAFLDAGDMSILKKVSILGGPATQLTKGKASILGATWTDDGFIVFGQGPGPLYIVGEGGGEAKPLTELGSADSAHTWPSAIPGTKIIVFTSTAGGVSPANGGQLAAFDRATNRMVQLKLPGMHPRWVPTGHVVYAAIDGTLRAVRFDPKTMTVSGNPIPVMEGVGVKLSGAAQFEVADDGRLVYSGGSSSLQVPRTLAWVDRTGKETPIAAPSRSYYYARLSPDGGRVTTDIREADQNTWIWDLKRETLLRLTDKPGQYQYGLWTPDNQRVVFTGGLNSPSNLFQMRPDGTGTMEPVTDLTKDKLTPYPNAVTPDGKYVIFRASVGANKNDLFYAPLTGSDHTYTKLLGTDHDEKNATVSPDGKWFAFESDLTGHNEVYVRPFPNADAAQFPISTAGGFKPAWVGREIFYLTEDGKMMAVTVDTTKGFVAEKPVELFKMAPYFTGAVGRNYDVTSDGKRFIMIKNAAGTGGNQVTPIVVVLNWAEELRGKIK
jgi:Tol biopolymer transport system component